MAVPVACWGSMAPAPSWQIPQEATTARTICLIDAVNSENCDGMKLPTQIGRKLWLTSSVKEDNVKAHLTFFFFLAEGGA